MMTDILFYDGNCPLCMHEMKLLARYKDDGLDLVNIHDKASSSLTDGLTNNTLLSVLHLKTANGAWLKGLEATVHAWRHTKFGWLFRPLRWPLIKNIADWVYYKWANKRACNLGYCSN